MKKRATLFFGFILFSIITFSQNLSLNTTFPEAQSMNIASIHDVFINFNQSIDTESLSDSSFRVFGRWSGPMPGKILWENGDSTLHFTPDEAFFFMENGSLLICRQ
jgi:hypothetical protein